MQRRGLTLFGLLISLGFLSFLLPVKTIPATAQGTGVTIRVSVAPNEMQANGSSAWPSISADGRYVAFQSVASNLVSNDSNNKTDVFVYDRQTGQTDRVSVTSSGGQGYDISETPSISGDGRYVAFGSFANLVSDDTNGIGDVYVYDRQTGQTTRVSVASNGAQANDGWSRRPSISADGRYVAFESYATNLVSGDNSNTLDVFVHDRQTGQTTRLTRETDTSAYTAMPVISANGRYIAFDSWANNLVSGDTNDTFDVFVYDQLTGQTTRISIASNGAQGNDGSYLPSISSDGRYVAFMSIASNFASGDTPGTWDVFIHDRQTGQTTRITQETKKTSIVTTEPWLSISADGRYIVLRSVSLDQIFIYDRQISQTSLISVALDGTQGSGISRHPSLSADGRYVAFDSEANNLVSNDIGYIDIFVRDRGSEPTYSISGRVTDNGGNPISGVTVSAGGGGTASTNSNGDYSLGGLAGGSYTVTPSASNYTFTPASRAISVPPNATGVDFVLNGAPGACVPDNQRIGISSANVCVLVTPFLEIPFPYTYTTFGTVMQGSAYTFATGKGRINSWFDHNIPTYNENQNLYRWDGEIFNGEKTDVDNCGNGLGIYCYDGHPGIDFSRRDTNNRQQPEPIWATAAGRVVYARDGCPDVTGKPKGDPDRRCGNYYGNQVWIDHGNGYATLYGHLALHSIPVTFTLTSGIPVAEKTFIGLMGNTGNSGGKHLHFGLYYDTSGNRTWVNVITGQILPTTMPVDSFGFWKTSRVPEDPWASQKGINSVYLWKYPLMSMMPINSSGGNAASPSSLVNVSVPPLALASQNNLEVWDAPPAALPLASQRSAGSSFWIRLWQAIAGSSVNDITAQTNAFAQPVTLNVNYGTEMVRHLNTSLLAIYHWDDLNNTWTALSSSVNTAQQSVSTQTLDTGKFDLQAPLLCPTDTYEVNDDYQTAKDVPIGVPTTFLFDIPDDEDWFRLEATTGFSYTIQTANLATGVDTIIELYNIDRGPLLVSDDNGGGGKASRLQWRAPADGIYFVRIAQASGSTNGCSAAYKLVLSQEGSKIYLPIIVK